MNRITADRRTRTGLLLAGAVLAFAAARCPAEPSGQHRAPSLLGEDLYGAPAVGRILVSDGFEADADGNGVPDPWWRRRGRLAWDDAVYCSGRRAVRIDGPGEWGRSFGTGRRRAFDPTRDFYITVRVRADSAVAARSVRLVAYYWDSSTKRPAGPRVESPALGGPTDGWTKLAVHVPAMQRLTDSVWVGVSLVSTSPAGRVWFDDLQVLHPAPLDPASIQPLEGKAAARRTRWNGQNAVRLENDWVRVTILPEAGGRIVEFTLKAAQTNVFKPDSGYEDWLHTDGKRRWPDLRKVSFRTVLSASDGVAAAHLTASAGPLRIERRVQIGPYSRLRITTRCTNRDDRPHRVALQTHPEFQMDDRTAGTTALVSRAQGPPVRIHSSVWIRNPGRWTALYHEPSGVFLAKLYSDKHRPERVHVYWNDFFCNIEEQTAVKLLAPDDSLTFSADYMLGRGCEPLDVSAFGALGLRVYPSESAGIRIEPLLFVFQPSTAGFEASVNGRRAASLEPLPLVPMLLHRTVFRAESALPSGGAAVVRVECRSAESTESLRAETRVDPGAMRLASRLTNAAWEDWGRIPNIGYWYWFGRLWFFGGKRLQTIEDGYRVRVHSGGPLFGVGYRWPKVIEPGYVYRFRLPFKGMPDFIAIDGRVVWEFGTGETDRKGAAVFFYAPGKPGRGMIWCVRDTFRGLHGEQDAIGLPAALRRVTVAQAWRTKSPPNLPDIRYPAWTEPENAWQTPCVQADLEQVYKTPVRFDVPPLKPAAYPTDDVRVGAMLKGLWRRPETYRLLCAHGIDGGWITEWQRGGPLPQETLDEIRRHVRDGRWKWFGSWCCTQHRWHTRPDWRKRLFPAAIQSAQYVTKAFPELEFYFMLPETQSVHFGDSPPADDFARMRRTIDILRMWKEQKIQPLLDHPERCRFIYNTDHALFPVAYYYQGGADIAMVKNIHRQNVEIVGANARGAGRAYGRPYALHYDPWNGIYVYSASPAELLHVLRMFYFYGADFIDHEGRPFFIETEDGVLPTAPAVSLLRAARFIRTHPRRGEPVIRIAVMRGFGSGAHPYDQDLLACRSTGGGWSRPRAGIAEMQDFNLLRVFLPEYGVYWRTGLERFCTGTPYGQFDLIPWDTPADRLRTYRLVVMMGLHGMDRGQWQRLETFVRTGGTLVAALGQFLAAGPEPRAFVAAEFATFPGIRPRTENNRPVVTSDALPVMLQIGNERYRGNARDVIAVHPPAKADVIAWPQAGDPVIVRVQHGRGRVFIFCTRYLTGVDEDLAARLLETLAEEVRDVVFDPPSDWMEYVVHLKGDTLDVALFNHGRMRFPTGNGPDHGAWDGELRLPFSAWPRLQRRAHLAAFAVDPESFHATPMPLQRTPRELRIRLRVDIFREVVIGPKENALDEFFRGPDQQ